MANDTSFTIASRFNGPPASGNGGYSAGLAAAFIDGPAAVELRAPPPLETALDVVRLEAGLDVRRGETLIMRAWPDVPVLTAPPAPPLAAARLGRATYPGPEAHGLPTCFVCGPSRAPGDGLCIFAGPVDGFDGVADVWTPDDSLADAEGRVRPEFLWAALDCPSAFAITGNDNLMLLGRICARIDAAPRVGEDLMITGWHDRSEGRKHFTGSALYSASGDLLAQADTLWIELKG